MSVVSYTKRAIHAPTARQTPAATLILRRRNIGSIAVVKNGANHLKHTFARGTADGGLAANHMPAFRSPADPNESIAVLRRHNRAVRRNPPKLEVCATFS
jgi:hypothetical protein